MDLEAIPPASESTLSEMSPIEAGTRTQRPVPCRIIWKFVAKTRLWRFIKIARHYMIFFIHSYDARGAKRVK